MILNFSIRPHTSVTVLNSATIDSEQKNNNNVNDYEQISISFNVFHFVYSVKL